MSAPELRHNLDTPPVLLPYQQRLLASGTSPVLVYEKSRRIGISWAAAAAAVEKAAASRVAGGMDVLYLGYNLEMARTFIDDAAFWAKWLGAFAGALPDVEEFPFQDDDPEHAVKAFRIAFASGFEIVALPSRPRSLRSKQGFVIIDEAAFHDDLNGMLKAALALLMWGGRVWILSTHDGADNPFNELVQECRAGRRPYKLLRTTFDDAIADGLYERIRLTAAPGAQVAARDEWIASIRAYYGEDAAEELDAIPAQGSGVWLTRALIEGCMTPAAPVLYLRCGDEFAYRPDAEREAFVAAWIEDTMQPLISRLDGEARSFAGGDFGRSGDLTAIWPGQLKGGVLRVPFAIELRNTPFRQQEQVMTYLLDRLPRFSGGAFDARGIGAALAEYAAQRYGQARIAQVKATVEWYRETMPRLKARFEDRTIEIPRDEDIVKDLRAVKVNKGVPMVPENSRATDTARGQRHGDAAIAAAMLHHAADNPAPAMEHGALGRPRLGLGAFDHEAPRANGRGFGSVGGMNDFGGFA